MNCTRRKKRYVGLSVVLVIMVVCVGVSWDRLTIQYHRRLVADSRSPFERPERLLDSLSPRTLRWILKGRPTADQNIQIGAVHEDALVQMGYFDRRSYYFTNENRQEFVTAVRAAPLKDRLCFFRFGLNGSLDIVAQREDFPTIERIIQRYGGKK